MRLRNRLWNPEHEQKTSVKQPKKSPQDDICLICPNYKDDHCKGLCPPLQWINGRGETKEYIPDNPIDIHPGQVEYNEKLHELMTDKETRDTERLEYIRTIANYKLRCIASCVLAHVPQVEIAKFAHISQGRISKLYRAVKR